MLCSLLGIELEEGIHSEELRLDFSSHSRTLSPTPLSWRFDAVVEVAVGLAFQLVPILPILLLTFGIAIELELTAITTFQIRLVQETGVTALTFGLLT
jgi:hypothetical protein